MKVGAQGCTVSEIESRSKSRSPDSKCSAHPRGQLLLEPQLRCSPVTPWPVSEVLGLKGGASSVLRPSVHPDGLRVGGSC